MVSAGFADIPVVAVALNPLNDQPGFKVNMVQYTYKLLLGLVYLDALSMMYHTSAVRETVPGAALKLTDKYLKPFKDVSLAIKQPDLLAMLSQAVAEFNNLSTQDRQLPQAGIIGEIYVKYNAFGNNHIVQWLMNQGIEAVVPSLLEFFMSNFIIWPNNMKMHLEKMNPLMWLVAQVSHKYMQGFSEQADGVLQKFKHYRPHHAIEDIANTAEKIIHLTNIYGEGWLIPGEIGEFVKEGVNNVLCLQPFGCLANHITAKGIEKRLKSIYPQLNLLFLDADAGVSEVNFFNRAHFFISHAKKMA
jgi:predicted nucleotide-binding protein (sugar kinase/HSP70/actin superfamily)